MVICPCPVIAGQTTIAQINFCLLFQVSCNGSDSSFSRVMPAHSNMIEDDISFGCYSQKEIACYSTEYNEVDLLKEL